MIPPTKPTSLFSAALGCAGVLVSSAGCLGPDGDAAQADDDDLKALEIRYDQLEEADTYLAFDDLAPEPIGFEFNHVYLLRADANRYSDTDAFPSGAEWLIPLAWPVSLLKAAWWTVDQAIDLARGSHYHEWTLDTANPATPLQFDAVVALNNLHWAYARGKASVRLCEIDRATGAKACDDLGSVKRGKKTIQSDAQNAAAFRAHDLSFLPAPRLKQYSRTYPVALQADRLYTLELKYQLECSLKVDAAAYVIEGDLSGACKVIPTITTMFVGGER